MTGFYCKLDSGSFTSCSSPLTYTTAGRGTHTVTVYAVDAAGNADPYPATVTVETHGPPVA